MESRHAAGRGGRPAPRKRRAASMSEATEVSGFKTRRCDSRSSARPASHSLLQDEAKDQERCSPAPLNDEKERTPYLSRSRPALAGATTRFFLDLMIWMRREAATFFDRPQFLAVINLLTAHTRL